MSDKATTPDVVHHNKSGLLEVARVQFLYRGAFSTVISSLLTAYTVLPVYYQVADMQWLYGWLAAMTLITLVRYLSTHYFLNRISDITRTGTATYAFMAGSLASGIAWGMSGMLFIPFATLDPDTQLLYICLYVMYCSALSAGCLANYAAYKPVWFCFAIPCMFPLMIMLALSSDMVRQTISLLMLIYFIFITRNMMNINRTIMESLILRLDKEDLNYYLDQEQERVHRLNQELKNDIEKRKKTEEELRKSKEHAEKLAADLLTLSTQDGLTGIPNRRSFDVFFEQEWNRAIRQQRSLAIIICDIDYYKSYNDIFGHQFGDDCLIRIAKLLNDFTRRSGEMAARYGGEEFILVLADTELEVARLLAEQIRQAVTELDIEHPGSRIAECLTLSLGVSAVTPALSTDRSDLIRLADQALYEAKSHGRNCVVAKGITDSQDMKLEIQALMQSAQRSSQSHPDDEQDTMLKDIVVKHLGDGGEAITETGLQEYLESQGYICQRYTYPPGTRFPMHTHEEDKIDAVLAGQFRISTEWQDHELQAGDYALIPAGLRHSAEVIGETEVVSLDAVKSARSVT